TGESVRRVSDFGYDPGWSPDGTELVVATEAVLDPMGRSGNSHLWAVRTSGEGKRLVSKGDAVGPRWSPDGRRIAYWGVRPATWHRDLWTIAADGSGVPLALTDDAAVDWGSEWSPDGRRLYFSSNRGGTMNLLRLPIDPRSGTALGAPEPMTTPAAWTGGLSFAKDGTRFAFGTRDWRTDAWRVAFDPDLEGLQGRPVPILRGQSLQELSWSPDGQWLVFTRRGLPWESLGVIRADGGGYSQLTDAAFQHRAARWAPDGRRIAFQSQRRGGSHVWTIAADGSALSQLTDGEEVQTPVWSQDGRRIAGAVAGGLALIDPALPSPSQPIETHVIAELRNPILWGILWSWSPDSRWLLYTPEEPGGLFLYAFETRTVRKLDESPEMADWLPDSRRILFNKRGALVLLDIVTGRRKEILPPRTLPVDGGWSTFALTRDGRSIAYLEARREGDIWLADLGGERNP
ncbi:MAG TPA: hypothetical protein VFM88_15280, partial [Vicinamibacteria bacterium]|nr:hypothetical protein [Vicinamibacteria bacterium]